ncbi:MAG: transposase [Planctomycetaceae bacterium]|nr:transposase [Planctomycetaceae bacterium]
MGKEFSIKKRKRHGPDEIIKKLREAELAAGRGEELGKVLQRLEISEQTLYRWKKQFGGMKAPDAKRLKELERENAQLKKLVADQALDVAMLKEVARGNF